ncbi:MAG: indolepyruvate ferredoxin oxidoreductase family protein [Burkholderiales bacterium]|nr:indolepyruvate ferredoxin oxidoreductase family protein [Burkholderiales bacterium]
MTEPAVRADYRLADNLLATGGQVFLTGVQALVRLALMQRALDVRRGLNTAGFVSGYRGSPLGMVDQAFWNAGPLLARNAIRFLPAVNEELAATAVIGSQRVETDPARTVDAVFSFWYGKGPGLDRAGDALKHGNAYGASPNGGVLVVAGDDHGCVSSSMPHQSDLAFQAWGTPVVSPASVAEILEFGLYGWALSRFAGTWTGLTALSEVVESGATVDLDGINVRVAAWLRGEELRAAAPYTPHPGGLHIRWSDPPSAEIEERLARKLEAVHAFARVNSIDREIIASRGASLGIVTCGKAHYDLMEVFRRLELAPEALAAAGVRLYKVGLSFPVERTRLADFARGLKEILVVEEKAPVVERQLRDLLYHAPDRPVLLGKHDAQGRALVAALGELRPSRLIETVAAWLARHRPELDRRAHVVDFTVPELLSNAADSVRRRPYFCSGCPHSTSTRVPEGSRAQPGIGCHGMAIWMNRSTDGMIQMGGEGVDWVGHAPFTREPHIFQNLGDGTYYHSGYLAIRQAVAAGARMTYKILYNDAVAMTGGQPIDGKISVDGIARQVEAEGAARVAVVSDDIDKYRALRERFPAGTTFDDRDALDRLQRELRELPGVTVLIYEQTCAAEKRRRRKKGALATPARRVFINQAVCEGCGDCNAQSNCLSVQPVETGLGRKRRIDQSSCNFDYSCVKGFCPSFVNVIGASLRKPAPRLAGARGGALEDALARLPHPEAHRWTGPYDLLVTGVGGTGVITVGTVLAMAAHLEFKHSSVLDFTGFAQKGGAVLSFVRMAKERAQLNQVRIDTQQADALLACDLVVGASNDALQSVRRARTRIVANLHEIPVATFLLDPDASLHARELVEKLRFAAGAGQVETLDAQAIAERVLGDSIGANVLIAGFAWQRGLIPLGLASIERALELNGVAVEMNKLAFGLGRLAAGAPQALAGLMQDEGPAAPRDLESLIAHRERLLAAYQDAAYAARYRALVERVRAAEARLGGPLALAGAVASAYAKLMAYKDEYEVARLFTDGEFAGELAKQFEGSYRLEFNLAPPLLSRPGRNGEPPRKLRFGPWLLPVLRLLARAKRLRGTWLDPFGRTQERRTERALIAAYEARIDELLPLLTPANLPLAVEIAALPEKIRGFGHVKLASLALARASEAGLLHRFSPERYPAPPASAPAPGIIAA